MTTQEQFADEDLSQQLRREFRVLRLLGSGGMGRVYLAEQIGVGRRRVALKVLKREIASGMEIVRRFKNEAAAAGRINNPHVVTVYECRTTEDGQTYIAMELVEGETLRERMEQAAPLEPQEIGRITEQVADGLNAAHRLGIVHRDIKPENVMLSRRGDQLVAKVLDFGIARLADQVSTGTASGVIIGSAKYMSPEQAAGKTSDEVDARSDVYSLGMVVYEMLTGRVAFEVGSWGEIVLRQISEPPPPLRSIKKGVPERAEKVILKALSKKCEDRYQSVVDFADELKSALTTVRSDRIDGDRHGAAMVPDGGRVADARNKEGDKKLVDRIDVKKLTIAVLATLIATAILAGYGRGVTWLCGSSVGAWVCSPSPTPTPSLTPSPREELADVMSYQIALKDGKDGLTTLPQDNTFRPGAEVRFRFLAAQNGAVYLLHKNEDGGIHWVNFVAGDRGNQPQTVREGVWSETPEDDYIYIDGKNVEQFFIVFVPPTARWSLKEVVHPDSILVGEYGLPVVPKDAARRVLREVQNSARMMSLSDTFDGHNITHHLAAKGNPDSLAFAEFQLKPSGR